MVENQITDNFSEDKCKGIQAETGDFFFGICHHKMRVFAVAGL